MVVVGKTFLEFFEGANKRGLGLEMTHFFNNKQVLMENVSFQDPKALFLKYRDSKGLRGKW